MRKVKVKIPGRGTIEVVEYETDIEEHTTAAEYSKRLDEEKKYDEKLDELASEVADRIDAAPTHDLSGCGPGQRNLEANDKAQARRAQRVGFAERVPPTAPAAPWFSGHEPCVSKSGDLPQPNGTDSPRLCANADGR